MHRLCKCLLEHRGRIRCRIVPHRLLVLARVSDENSSEESTKTSNEKIGTEVS